MTFLPGTKGRRRIYLMRHGHVDYFSASVITHGSDGVPLTARGREEAEIAGKALSHVSFDRAICSGLPRARATAEIVLSQQAGAAPDLVDDQRLRELKGGGSAGSFRGFDDLVRQIRDAMYDAHLDGARMGPSGEFFQSAYDRATEAVEAYLSDGGWSTMLIVAHEGINRLLLSWATNSGLDAVGAFEQDTACINVLDADLELAADGATLIRRKIIKAVNLTPYNYVKHGMNMTSLEAIFSRE